MNRFNNTHSGAVYPTATEGLMAGPYTLPDGTEARAFLERDEGGKHRLTVYGLKKDGTPKAKAVATGTVSRHPKAGRITVNGHPYPAGLARLVHASGITRLLLWKMEHDLHGTYYQVKPDKGARAPQQAFDL